MIALSPSARSLCATPAIALVLLACSADAGPTAATTVDPAFAERIYVNPIGEHDVSAPTPVHRYRFDGQGASVHDSIGGADGSLVAADLAGDGFLRLPGGGAYVELPGGLLSQHQSATLELWLAWEGHSSNHDERIFHFGADTGEPNDSDFFLSPSYDDAKPRIQFRDASGAQSQLFGWRYFPERRTTHVVVVLDHSNHSMAFYIDGESLGSSPWNQTLAELGDDNVWLGRSPKNSNLSATFDEFRIYDQALSSAQVEQNFSNGPDGVSPSDSQPHPDAAQPPIE